MPSRAHAAEVGALPQVFEKSATEPKPNLLRCKNIVKIVTFNVWLLNTINQLPKHNEDILCMQEHRYYHNELELKCHDAING